MWCRFLVDQLDGKLAGSYGAATVDWMNGLPTNDAMMELAQALATAHEHYSVNEYVDGWNDGGVTLAVTDTEHLYVVLCVVLWL